MDRDYVVYLGDVALDEYYAAPYWPQLKDKVLVKTLPPMVGGTVANAACVYARLQRPVVFLSLLNSGPITQVLLRDLRESGIDTGSVLFDDALPDSKTMIFLCEDEHAIIIPTMGIEAIDVPQGHIDRMAGARFVYSTPGNLRLLRCGDKNWIDILREIRAAGAEVVCDFDVDHERRGDGDPLFGALDIAFFNEVGFSHRRAGRGERETAEGLLQLGVKVVVVTLAEQGCRVYTADGCAEAPGFRVPVVDVTGAGDTFCSSFLYLYGETGDPAAAARFANAAAAICVGTLGPRAGAVGREAVEAFLKKHA